MLSRRARALAHSVLVGTVVMSLIVVLRVLGLAGTTPLWVFAVLVVVGTTFHEPALHRALSGGDLSRRLWPRVAMRYLVNTATIYATGWGPVLAVTHLVLLSEFTGQSGSRAWRPAAVCSAVTIGLGELAINAGLYSYLPEPQVHGVAVLVAAGTVLACRFFGAAVRAREQVETALRGSEERFRSVVQDGSDMVTFTDRDGVLRYVSPNSSRVVGHEPEVLLGDGLWKLIHPDDRDLAHELRARIREQPDTEHSAELRFRRADGVWRWHEVVVRNLLDRPEVDAVVGHQRDVHDRRTAQDRIAYAATHDALTGLLNASAFQLALEETLGHSYPVGLLFLDLDGFKQVNDVLGHAAGDERLRLVADVLRTCGRERDVLGRLGGDEFVVALNGVGGSAQAEAIAAAIIQGIDAAQPPDDGGTRVGCSIGIALAQPGEVDARGLVRRADAAMYTSKRRRRNGYELSAGSMPAVAG
ncbi:diguanylate cyclase domain-containing protein [Cryptosporangium phraense]|uniref:Diguanylate cyclase n=1 Tax=Cryptosporangium phraense TaxID=2593070 RepID=A0A545AUC4_9ACTN|nr:diguanylate cyclase [Cryptosporangium phraense]TQS44195.1 diguanylate cyclase [Cryptosporangium phraense]